MKLEPITHGAESSAWNIPGCFNYGKDVVDNWASTSDKDALIWCNEAGDVRRFRFSDISRLSNKAANLLTRLGVKKGDRVVVMLPRLPEWHITIIACLKIGAVPIPSISMLTKKDVEYRVSHAEAVGAITTSANSAKFPTTSLLTVRLCVDGDVDGWTSYSEVEAESSHFECADTGINDPALLYYTSGSSGNPKGVLHSVRSLCTWPVAIEKWLDLTSDDIMWSTADTGWTKAATGSLFGQWRSGTCVLFYDGPFDPIQRLRIIERFGVTVFCAAATEFRHLVQLPSTEFHFSRLRLSASAGETVNPEVVEKWLELSQRPLREGYGQTETLITIINSENSGLKPGSIGQSAPGTENAILADDMSIAGPGETGRLILKLPCQQFMMGYFRDEQKTKESIVEISGDKYWLTGDLAYQDEEGHFFYVGRADDIINSAGYRIGPTEVENALIEHPSVVECAVVGSPDVERGLVVKAFVVLHQDFVPSKSLLKELQSHVKALTAPYKYPRKIEFVKSLPKSAAGKVLRRVLREQEEQL